ncbi:MAG: hypothetical protein HOO96_36990 [Polyangiaceae bacterium]|nr:hypothetical protein [Polyangiaceae bacterium]
MMFTRALPLAMLVSVSATGCMGLFGPARTPMPANEVAALTTCKTGDLSKIKKNLVLAGYGVTRSDGDIIETDFKQVTKFGSTKELEKISVVRVDENTTKFKVKVRVESKEEVESAKVKDGSGRTVATGTRLENTTDESETQYYQEGRPQYEEARKAVCGG